MKLVMAHRDKYTGWICFGPSFELHIGHFLFKRMDCRMHPSQNRCPQVVENGTLVMVSIQTGHAIVFDRFGENTSCILGTSGVTSCSTSAGARLRFRCAKLGGGSWQSVSDKSTTVICRPGISLTNMTSSPKSWSSITCVTSCGPIGAGTSPSPIMITLSIRTMKTSFVLINWIIV